MAGALEPGYSPRRMYVSELRAVARLRARWCHLAGNRDLQAADRDAAVTGSTAKVLRVNGATV